VSTADPTAGSSPAPAPAPAPAAAQTFAGVDVSKDRLQLCLLCGDRRRDLSVAYDDAGLRQLADACRSAGVVLVVLEGSGGYQRRCAAALLDAGLRVVVINPRQARDFARALGLLAKSDPIDAFALARFAQLVRPEPRPRPTPGQSELADLLARRGQLLAMRTAEANRLQQATLNRVRDGIKKVIRLLDRQVQDLDEEIGRRVEADPDLKLAADVVRSAPGVGTTTARALVVHLPELGRLGRGGIAALAGLAPYDDDSGQSSGARHIRGGRAPARTCLFMATLCATRFNPAIKAMYERLLAAGKRKMVALTACMRKFLTILNAMVRHGTTWDDTKWAPNP
jgi:transposase